jgi:hypothetical protein
LVLLPHAKHLLLRAVVGGSTLRAQAARLAPAVKREAEEDWGK